MLSVLALTLVIALACGGEDEEYVPTPTVERIGQEVVIGDQGPSSGRNGGHGAAGAPGANGSSPDERLMANPNVTVVEPVVDDVGLGPVADRYDELITAGTVDGACPDGTTKTEPEGRGRTEDCRTPAGIRHGPTIIWHSSGKLKNIGPYVKGKRHGLWFEWDRTAKEPVGWRWIDGQPTSQEDINP